MPKNRLVLGLLLASILFISYNYTNSFRKLVVETTNDVKLFVVKNSEQLNTYIRRYFDQAEQIEALQKQVEVLKPSAQLSTVFATKLNQLLEEADLQAYRPALKLARVISYAKLDDPNCLWLDIPSYDQNTSYGLIHEGSTAGIVYPEMGMPLATLQLDKRVVFSVLIGEEEILGVIFGNDKNMLIKFIPSHANVKVGDEVITSGKDKLFYEGIRVGKIVEIKSKEIYQVAVVEPYMKERKPNFFYLVDLGIN